MRRASVQATPELSPLEMDVMCALRHNDSRPTATGLNPPQVAMTARGLGRPITVGMPGISRCLADLKERGLVDCFRPRDGRGKRLPRRYRLSPAGLAMINAAAPPDAA